MHRHHNNKLHVSSYYHWHRILFLICLLLSSGRSKEWVVRGTQKLHTEIKRTHMHIIFFIYLCINNMQKGSCDDFAVITMWRPRGYYLIKILYLHVYYHSIILQGPTNTKVNWKIQIFYYCWLHSPVMLLITIGWVSSKEDNDVICTTSIKCHGSNHPHLQNPVAAPELYSVMQVSGPPQTLPGPSMVCMGMHASPLWGSIRLSCVVIEPRWGCLPCLGLAERPQLIRPMAG